MEHESHTPDTSDQPGPPLPDRSKLPDRSERADRSEPTDHSELPDRRELIAHHMAALEDLIDPEGRSDGWTPAARMGFLRLVAEHGRVSHACQCIGLSKQSVYSLRARDPLFAIGWDSEARAALSHCVAWLGHERGENLASTPQCNANTTKSEQHHGPGRWFRHCPGGGGPKAEVVDKGIERSSVAI